MVDTYEPTKVATQLGLMTHLFLLEISAKYHAHTSKLSSTPAQGGWTSAGFTYVSTGAMRGVVWLTLYPAHQINYVCANIKG